MVGTSYFLIKFMSFRLYSHSNKKPIKKKNNKVGKSEIRGEDLC